MESVWDYPRPPRIEPTTKHIVVRHRGALVAETRRALRVLETSHAPVYYMPPDSVDFSLVRPAPGTTFCEWKGSARYWDVVIGNERLERAAWSYPDPSPAFAALEDHLAFYANRFDACLVDGEKVVPQEGSFYGGWITRDIRGPFKGGPGSAGW